MFGEKELLAPIKEELRQGTKELAQKLVSPHVTVARHLSDSLEEKTQTYVLLKSIYTEVNAIAGIRTQVADYTFRGAIRYHYPHIVYGASSKIKLQVYTAQ